MSYASTTPLAPSPPPDPPRVEAPPVGGVMESSANRKKPNAWRNFKPKPKLRHLINHQVTEQEVPKNAPRGHPHQYPAKRHHNSRPRTDKLVLAEYQSEIDQLLHQIKQLHSQNDSAEIQTDLEQEERLQEIRLTYEFKLAELETQRQIYLEVKKRTIATFISKPTQLSAQLYRELYRFQQKLPIFSKRLEIETYISDFTPEHRFLIIQGETGSGKSTQLPQYFADHPRFDGKKILCIQPRKLAAVSLAQRVTTEYYWGDVNALPGHIIGYRVAGKNFTRQHTRIEFVTEGKILEDIISGSTRPFENVGAIILDEAHERSINCDLLLGCFKLADPRWLEIMVVVTSATIDLDLFSAFFNQAPSIVVNGRTFPVTVNYKEQLGFGFTENTHSIVKGCVKCALQIHLDSKLIPGDILCFLPGQADVLSAVDLFHANYKQALQLGGKALGDQLMSPRVLPLYGRMEPEHQAKIFEQFPGQNVRKIIFSTDIAETSVTIDGVVHVIDSGVKKGIVYDAKSKISSLRLQQISRSSAIQRMGRAGRTQAGECHRLYAPEDFESMEFGSNPEVLARPLALAVLTLRKMKMDPQTFPWISPPPIDSIIAAEEELCLLGAFTMDQETTTHDQVLELTELGHLISTVQQEPCFVKMIHYGCQKGFGEAAITLVSILSASGIFYWSGSDIESKTKSMEKKKTFAMGDGDVVSLYRAFREWLKVTRTSPTKMAGIWCRDNFVNGKAMKIIVGTSQELRCYFRNTNPWKAMPQLKQPSNEELSRIVFSGLFLNASFRMQTPRSQWRVQYCSLLNGIPGYCSREAVFALQPNPPDWIVYYRILQVPITLFLTCNKISPDWLRQENEDFYLHCIEKSLELPTSITRMLSPEIISALVGKFFSNIRSLEAEFDSTIDFDLETGRLTLFCTKNKLKKVEEQLEMKIKSVLTHLEEIVIEQEYLGGCRLLIGPGFHIKDVLFSGDYVALFLRNLPVGLNEDDVKEFIQNQNLTSANTLIQSIQLFRGANSGTATVTFSSKDCAQEFNQKCYKEEMLLRQQRIRSNPRVSKQRGISAEIMGKLKFSWAAGFSTQDAKIWFKTAHDANTFIAGASRFVDNATVSAVSTKRTPQNTRIIPPTHKVSSYQHGPLRYRFDEDAIALIPDSEKVLFEYTVSVKNIPLRLDEYGIMELLRYLNVTGVRVVRKMNPDWVENRSNLQLPVKDLIETYPSFQYEDKTNLRNGISIPFSRLSLLREAYRTTVSSEAWRNMEKSFGQTPRLEIEYFYTATILRELYLVLKTQFEGIMDYARELKVHIQNPLPHVQEERNSNKNPKSKFIYIRFQSFSEMQFPEIKKKVEEVSSCRKFKSDCAHLLYSSTGNDLLTKFPYRKYLFTNYYSQTIWIYGDEELKIRIIEGLQELVIKLKSIEVLDHQLSINKKIVRSDRERERVLRQCRQGGMDFCDIRGSKLTVSGTEEAVNKLKKILEEKKYIFTHRRRSNPHQTANDCGLCFCQPDDRKYVMTTNCLLGDGKCGRTFCLECIQPLFDQRPTPFPLKCPTCDMPLFIKEIMKWGSPTSLQKIMEVAVQNFKKNNTEKVLSCPKPGCEQLLSTESIKKGFYGGDFVFCDECVTSYCLDCSKNLDVPMEMHEDESCEDFQSGTPHRAFVHVKTIRDTILNLCCPRCQTPYLDFDGCGALTCSCGCCFCALCLEDCGNDSHVHVVECKWNSTKSYFLLPTDLMRSHRGMRILKIKEYLQNVPVEEHHRTLSILCKDLLDLGIHLTEIEAELQLGQIQSVKADSEE